MKLEKIQELWDEDSKIDKLYLSDEALKIGLLHAKYYRIFVQETLVLRQKETELSQLKFDKYEFYTMGPTEETVAKGWELPPRGKILKNETSPYVDNDHDVIKKTLEVALQKEKVQFVKSVIDSINQRSWNIRTAVDFERFRAGA